MEKDFSVISSFDKLEIKGHMFVPSGNIKGIFFISHGMSEHKERYYEFMKFLSDNQYISVIHDHRGHGESVKDFNDLGYFGDEKGEAIVEDLKEVIDFIKDEYPNNKIILFGHSMGSLVVRKFIQKYDNVIDKLIVCGSPSNNSMVMVALLITKLIKFFRGERYRSRFIEKMSTGNGDKLFSNDNIVNAWLCSDLSVVREYNEGIFTGFIFTTNGYLNLFHLVIDVYSKGNYKINNLELPIYFIAGDMDPVIKSEKKWMEAISFLRDIGYTNISYKLYNDMRHEILNEVNKKDVYNDIISFID